MSEQCCARVRGGGFRRVPCSKPAKYLVDGKHYCGTHNPAAAEARRAKANAAVNERIAATRRRSEAMASIQDDAARYRWLRMRWGRIAENYDDDSDRMVWIGLERPGEGWDVDPTTLDASIDAAMASEDRYTLSEAYRAVMQQGAKLNGEVKAREEKK